MKIIIYDPTQFELIFSIATIKQWLKNQVLVAIPAAPIHLSSQNFWENQINAVEDIYNIIDDKNNNYGNSGDGDKYDELEDEEFKDDEFEDNFLILKELKEAQIYILGLGPESDEDIPHLVNFFDQNKKRIAFWLDNHRWYKEELKYFENKIQLTKRESYLEILGNLGFQASEDWKIMEKIMLSREKTYFPLLIRYWNAIQAGLVISNNDDDPYYFTDTLIDIVEELATGKPNENIEELCENFLDMEESTEAAKEELTFQSNFFPLSAANNIEIALFDLGEIKIYVNLLEIIEEASQKHDNVVIYYTIDDYPCFIISLKNNVLVDKIREAIESYADEEEIDLDKTTILRLIDGELVYQTKKNRARAAKKKFKKKATIKA
jgi:hypothetical protein